MGRQRIGDRVSHFLKRSRAAELLEKVWMNHRV